MATLDEAMAKVVAHLNADIDELLVQVVEECSALRDLPAPDVEDGPYELHEQLVAARKAADRLGTHVGFCARLHANSMRVLNTKKQDVEDAEAATIGGRSSITTDYSTAKEKNAELLLKTTDQRIGVRKAERRVLVLAEVLDYTRHCLRTVNDTRHDLSDRIRLVTMQTQLEK